MPSIERVVIAAAGLGSRLGHGIPKCLVEINGQTLIERQLKLLAPIGDIRVVVGYMEQAVIDAVRRINEDVIFVRNPRYRETTTQDSYALGARGVSGSCLFLDADIIFQAASLSEFLKFAATRQLTIGVTATKTDHAIFAVTRDGDDGESEITSFSSEPAPLEWANIVYAPSDSFGHGRGAVFETLQTMLPAPAKQIVCYEIDTEADLDRAKGFVERQLERTAFVSADSSAARRVSKNP
jgi:NDP-sugar pyrophosphorylase family protein